MLTTPAPGSLGDLAAAFSPDGETVAIIRSPVLGVSDLSIVPVTGGQPRRITFDHLKVHGLDWTADGGGLVFSSNRGGLFGLWRVSADGGEPTWITGGGGDVDAPSSGPDGALAYEQWSDVTHFYRIDLERPEVPATPLLTSTRFDWHPSQSPAGDRLAFVSDRGGTPEIWTATLDDLRPTRRTEFGGPYLTTPRWSPDGSRIAFDARVAGNADLYLIDGDAARPRRLTDHDAEDVAPAFSGDGRWVYFGSSREDGWQIWKLPVAGGAPVRVTRDGGIVSLEAPDGRSLYVLRREVPGLWNVPLGGGEERLVSDLPLPIDHHNWIVGDSAIYFVARPEPEGPTLSRLDLATGTVSEVAPLPDVCRDSGLALSPDGRYVTYTRNVRREADLVLLRDAG